MHNLFFVRHWVKANIIVFTHLGTGVLPLFLGCRMMPEDGG
ncbi:hypothetical protein NU09_1899 [Flavobacterium beibuense]|uniref:Uncharacterized protein n=1 Tax=Flavobacterium beibuense TaxID=657326 RepID=A0A444WA93_9FLAO|nr:hypothetical protein NU09_1899 [Flavobacterium beibuense]